MTASTTTSLQAWSDWARHVDGAGIDVRKSQGFEHTYFMLEAAASGLGIGIASHPLVEHDLQSGRLVARFGFTPTGKSYCVLHAKQAAGNAKIEAFRAWIVSVAQRSRGAASTSHVESCARASAPPREAAAYVRAPVS
jgi:DNA-binding transcriptional LysR family regulator